MRDIKKGPSPTLTPGWLELLRDGLKAQKKSSGRSWNATDLARAMSEKYGKKVLPRNTQRLLKGDAGNRFASEAAAVLGVHLPAVELRDADDNFWIDLGRRLKLVQRPEEYEETKENFRSLLDGAEAHAAKKRRMFTSVPPHASGRGRRSRK